MAEEPKPNDFWYPDKQTVRRSHVKDYEALRAKAAEDLVAFWEERAKELKWYKRWTRCWTTPASRSSSGSSAPRPTSSTTPSTGTSPRRRRNKLALIWEGENGDLRTFSYFALHREVCRFANVLKSMGVNKGDRVTIYMPRIPELLIAMLACAKIGAVHSVVYGGFSVEALHGRIEDRESSVLITADGGWMQRQDRRAEGHRRRGAAARRHRGARDRRQAHRPGGQHGGRPRLLVPRADGPADSRRHQRHVPHRGDGRRGPAVHPLHLRHHRQAQGHPPHPRRLHGRASPPRSSMSSTSRRGPLVVRRRPGLDHRATRYIVYGPLLLGATSLHVRRRARPTRTPTAGGRWSRSTASRSSTPRPPPSAA